MYNFRCRTRIAGGFMVRDYVTNQSKDNNEKPHILGDRNVRFIAYKTVTYSIIFENEYQIKI